MANKSYNRIYLRKHFASNIYVSNDGRHAERDIHSKSAGQDTVLVYNIYKEECGRAFIHDKYKGTFYLDELVLTCFRGLPPQDGKKYFPHHRDGDFKNSTIANLEWREETPETAHTYERLSREAWYKNRKIKAYRNGTVKQNGSPLHFVDYIYDSDVDWTFHYTAPWVRYVEKNRYGRMDTLRKDVTEIFEDSGFIQGDRSRLQNPVVLHKNNDYMDFNSDNLEWVEATDPRYVEFKRVSHEMKMKKDHDSNYRVSPASWDTLYGGDEPYRDWTDRERR